MNSGAVQKMEQKSADRVTAEVAAVPKGYKRTELGVIPDDWGVSTVGEAFEIRNQLRLPISQELREHMVGPYPYYGPTNVQSWINEYRIEGEHALIGEDGDHFLKWREQAMTLLVNGKFNVNNHAHVVRGTKNLTTWFYWFFANRDICNHLTRQGAGRYKLTKATLQKLPCAVPPLPEQQAIAGALSDVDGWVTSLDALIAKKRDLKTATMQQLLTGHTRLPGFAGEWETKKLGDTVEIKKGQLITEKTAVHGDVPVIAGGLKPSYYHNQPNRKPNVVTISASGASAGFVGFHSYAIFASDCSTIEQSNSYDVKFIFFALQSRQAEIYKLQTGGAQPHVYPEHIRDLHVALPPTREEQAAIATILSDMDAEIAMLDAERDKASAIKQGMMQELLTGKTRLV